MRDRLFLKVTEPSQVAEARRRVLSLAVQLGFNETRAGMAALLVTEMGTNLVKHAVRDGQILVWGITREGISGLEILALDRGPGIYNVARALEDGYSTGGSTGTGLGAIRRQSSFFDIYSRPGKGTAILCRLWAERDSPPESSFPLLVGGIHLAKPGQDVCGDAWATSIRSEQMLVMVADGLGHGQEAALASGIAASSFYQNSRTDLPALIRTLHLALQSTRGAAIALVLINPASRQVRFVGVGNVAGSIQAGELTRHLISHNGTVGHVLHRVQEFSYEWPPGGLMILHTDGIQTRWDLADYPGLSQRHPTLIAGVLYRDFRRGNDDATVVVVRQPT